VYTKPSDEYERALATGEPGFDRLGRDVIESFRAAYEQEGLRDAGVMTFAGQEVRRCTASRAARFEHSWCISIATGVPVGTTYRGFARSGTTVVTTRVVRHETLEPTAANLSHLRFTH
jgi:hypothetical protein